MKNIKTLINKLERLVDITNYAGIDTKTAYQMTYKAFKQLKNLAARA